MELNEKLKLLREEKGLTQEDKVSIIVSVITILFTILARDPYPAVLAFILLMIKLVIIWIIQRASQKCGALFFYPDEPSKCSCLHESIYLANGNH